MELVEVSKKLCKTCKYSTEIDCLRKKDVACVYINEGNGSRVFYADGSLRIDPKMCDKYERVEGRRPTGHMKKRDLYFGKGKSLKRMDAECQDQT